ncbi:hypothetical protein niasHS_010879 [Heterodera schachtii]|uniref:Protein HIRA n=1 Tax=Heterodera schachtii TaxID=97005 RepID=A0ABD2ISW5_HETSC
MQIFEAPWITHEGGSIFSLDFHPNGCKLATAGQDPSGAGLLIVWDLSFLNCPPDSKEFNCSQLPLTRIPHTSTINCVRWSKHSATISRLVCAGDDSMICVYECVGVYSSEGSFSNSLEMPTCQKRNIESYRCTHKLYGHSIDVLHIDWSSDGRFLASCSLDSTIIVWNALKLPEKVIVLKQTNDGHVRGVKGLAWDPIGRFLATQSEDNTLKIWQTDSWNCVRTFREPFQESANSTLFCRMDWSSEGSFLVAPCSMNNGGPTAKIFVRKDWSHRRDFVGFRKAVSCVRANSACFQRVNSIGTHSVVSCFAVGCRDRSLSVWLLPNFGRPLLVIDKLFKLSVIDLSWNKLLLAACSRDGIVKLFKFSECEIGQMLSSHETSLLIERTYGLQPQFLLPTDSCKFGRGFSADFGYTSICDKITATAMERTLSQDELFQIAFNCEAKTKFRTERIRHFAEKAKKLLKTFNTSEGKMTPQKERTERNCEDKQQKSNGILNFDGRLYELKKDDEHAEAVLFEMPELKRVIFVQIGGTSDDSPPMCLEVLNGCFGSESTSKLAAMSAAKINQIFWEFFVSFPVAFLSANSRWTVFSSFDAHFYVLSTQTGRLQFELCLDEPLAVLELEQNLCLSVGIAGSFALWDLLNGKVLARHSLKELLGDQNKQLLASTFSLCKNEKEANSTSMFLELLFSDFNSFAFSSKLGGWNKAQTVFDFVNEEKMPPNISSVLLQMPNSSD